MKIGIIGAGHIGATLARNLVAAGHEVAIANSRGPETLRELVDTLGERATAATVAEAAEFGGLAIEAIPYGEIDELPNRSLDGRILVSASNYYPERDGRIAELEEGRISQTGRVARHIEGARVVKAFNTIYWEHLRDRGKPDLPPEERRAIPIAGDDADAKKVVAHLIEEMGFAPVDVGGLEEGGSRLEPGSPVYNVEMTPEELRGALGTEGRG